MIKHQKKKTFLITILILVIITLIIFLAYILLQNDSSQNEANHPIAGYDLNSPKQHIDSKNVDLVIDKPVFKSKTIDNETYVINAERAIKTSNDKYLADNVIAEMQNYSNLFTIKADQAIYGESANHISLIGNVVGNYMNYRIRANELDVKLDSQEISADKGVMLRSNDISISSETMRSKGQDLIEFEGNVKTIINFSN